MYHHYNCRIWKQSTKKIDEQIRKKCLCLDTKKGMKQKKTEKVEEKTRKEEMAEKRKARNADKSIGITEN